MPANSMKYFFDRNENLSTEQIIGYFDFSNTGISGLINIPSESWTSRAEQLQLVNSGNFWTKSGFASFDGQSYAKLNYFSGDSISFIFAYKLGNEKSDNVFFANYNYDSGVNFGINYAGYPYFEYAHKIYGPVTVCHNLKANKTGVVSFSINGSNSISMGLFDPESNSFQKVFAPLDENFKKSNNYYIGGVQNLPSGRFLSAEVAEIFIYNSDYLSSSIFENEFVSGIVSSISSNTITGAVSGQTGILNGDIIKITQCSAQASGVLNEIILSTGSGEYFATHESFLDFNNEIFNQFSQKVFTGYFLGYSSGQNLFSLCSSVFTGTNVFEYDSGYYIEYSITNNSAFVSRPEYIYSYQNAISLSFNIDSGDILSIYGYSGIDARINFTNLYYINADNSYGYDSIIGEDFSGLYYNGQLQTRSSGYEELIQGGNIDYMPSEDYFISGNKIFSNSNYGFINQNNSLIDFWPKSELLITGQINSGNNISSLDFNNSFVFLNGQLLNSGIDYSGSNTILRNISGNYNVLTVQKNILGFSAYSIKNTSGSYFSVPFNFNKKTSMIWLNGQRLYIGFDYQEVEKSDEIDIITYNTGVIIYNL
jgi:hypothetical protein